MTGQNDEQMTVRDLRAMLDEWEKCGLITGNTKVKVCCASDYVVPVVQVNNFTDIVLIDWMWKRTGGDNSASRDKVD